MKRRSAAQATRKLTAAQRRRIDPESRLRAIFHIWPDFEVSACINKSIATVKADAAQNSFSARGAGITWAVMDSGIQKDHPHFRKYANFDPASAWHKDFTVDGGGPVRRQKRSRHARRRNHRGRMARARGRAGSRKAACCRLSLSERRTPETSNTSRHRLEGVSGMAPQCKLVSLRVLDENGKGAVSNLIAAIDHVQEINGQGRRLLIHGVNMSLGYNFEPEWFACGQSPLCVEVDRLVKTGVVVVVAAGNTGYGTLKSDDRRDQRGHGTHDQ